MLPQFALLKMHGHLSSSPKYECRYDECLYCRKYSSLGQTVYCLEISKLKFVLNVLTVHVPALILVAKIYTQLYYIHEFYFSSAIILYVFFCSEISAKYIATLK